jgi:hypothetical protein
LRAKAATLSEVVAAVTPSCPASSPRTPNELLARG